MTWLVVAVLVAGGGGAVARFAVDAFIRASHQGIWPWATMVVNVLGSGLLGWLTATAAGGTIGAGWFAVLGVGFCGGFTTLSTASVEVLRLAQQRHLGVALGCLVGQAVLCVGAAWVGLLAGG